MGECVIVYGKSGTGKSRSLKNFEEDEILYFNTINKRLPFTKKFKYEVKTANPATVKAQLSKMPLKIAVVDDFGYQMTDQFMTGHSKQHGGGSVFDLYNRIADNAYDLIMHIKSLPDDVIVYLLMHEDTTDSGETGLKTIGKLLNEKVCVEGMVTICLRAMKEGTNKYFFRTQSDGNDISKSPEDMFELEIENDLAAVDKRIREYWGLSK